MKKKMKKRKNEQDLRGRRQRYRLQIFFPYPHLPRTLWKPRIKSRFYVKYKYIGIIKKIYVFNYRRKRSEVHRVHIAVVSIYVYLCTYVYNRKFHRASKLLDNISQSADKLG